MWFFIFIIFSPPFLQEAPATEEPEAEEPEEPEQKEEEEEEAE